MNDPVGAREALIIEAIGEVANLVDSVERLASEIEAMAREFDRANAGLRDTLAGFEAHVTALTEKAKVQVVRHILARTEESARRSIEQQRQAMEDTARLVFSSELSANIRRFQSANQRHVARCGRGWERWLTHTAAAATASAVTWTAAAMYLAR